MARRKLSNCTWDQVLDLGREIAAKQPEIRCWEFVHELQKKLECDSVAAEEAYDDLVFKGSIRKSDAPYTAFDRYLAAVNQRSFAYGAIYFFMAVKKTLRDELRTIGYEPNRAQQKLLLQKYVGQYGYSIVPFVNAVMEECMLQR